MNLWYRALDSLTKAVDSSDDLSTDQQLKVAEIQALLSIGQELSLIQDQGISPTWSARSD